MARVPIYAVIMAGGQGTRFWPASRRLRAKQFLPILGKRTMLEQTVDRFRGLCLPSRTLVVTGVDQASLARKQAPRLPAANFLLEPEGRNTAPCIALAAETILRHEDDAVMVCVAADHAINDAAGFRATMRRAIEIAAGEDALVTIGVRPSYAETGYGYIELGDDIPGSGPRAYRAAAFHEKPQRDAAERYFSSGRFLWNACMFVWRAKVIQREIATHMPALAKSLAPLSKARTKKDADALVRRAYRRIDSVAIDYGVMEKAENVAVVAADFGWNDVGSWAAMPDVWGADDRANATRGPVQLLEAGDNVVLGDHRLVALLGVHGLIVVDTPDALLICPKERAQDVRKVVDELKRKRRRDLL